MRSHSTVEQLLDRARIDLMSCHLPTSPARQRLTAQLAGLRAAAAVTRATQMTNGKACGADSGRAVWESLRRASPSLYTAAAPLYAKCSGQPITAQDATGIVEAAEHFVALVERTLHVRR